MSMYSVIYRTGYEILV